LGFNYRLTDLHSALGLSQVKKLDQFIAKRRALANRYDEFFSGATNCQPLQRGLRERSGNHLYVLAINFKNLGCSRAELMLTLREKGIGSQVHYIPVPCHPYYRNLGHDPAEYPNAMKYYEAALSIPLFVDLDDKSQALVCSTFEELVG